MVMARTGCSRRVRANAPTIRDTTVSLLVGGLILTPVVYLQVRELGRGVLRGPVLAYLLIFAALLRLRAHALHSKRCRRRSGRQAVSHSPRDRGPGADDHPVRHPFALAVVQSVLTDGAFDAWKGLSILVVLATGPVTFLVFRGKGERRATWPHPEGVLAAVMASSHFFRKV